MRKLIVLLACLGVCAQVGASSEPEKPSKPITPEASAKTEGVKKIVKEVVETAAKEPPKEMPKKSPALSSKEATKEAAMLEKEADAREELANKVAAKLSTIRKKWDTNPSSRRKFGRPVVKQSELVNAAALVPAHGTHWSYEGEGGPIRWGKINAAWSQCETGVRQSPIDIRDGIKVDLEPIRFDYKPNYFNVIDNGHTVQVNMGGGNYITIMGKLYELVQFHFHRPSEERVNGRGFSMVVHLVHKDVDGRLAVVALLIEEGWPNTVVQTVWNNLPLEKNEPVTPTFMMDLNPLLPQRREYYTYMGSLTTPPCSEGVLWIVMKEPIQMSAQQIGIFARLYPMNARPIQMSSGRLIKESN